MSSPSPEAETSAKALLDRILTAPDGDTPEGIINGVVRAWWPNSTRPAPQGNDEEVVSWDLLLDALRHAQQTKFLARPLARELSEIVERCESDVGFGYSVFCHLMETVDPGIGAMVHLLREHGSLLSDGEVTPVMRERLLARLRDAGFGDRLAVD